jgi:vacuolar-type H+-ATPase subunit I/STV1
MELREDIDDVLNAAITAIGNMSINQFDCDWRGNTALEIGDKIALVTKDNQTVTSYLLNDSLSYNGALAQKTKWHYTESEDTPSNPVTLGETLKQTYAKVDKANKTIEMVASEASANSEAISVLQMSTDSINTSVQKIENNTAGALESVNADIMALTSRVEASMTAQDVTLAIKSELANGVDKVETSTGFTFNEEGLTVSKSGTEMTTQITEDGMTIRKDGDEMLVANNQGVTAYDLHAKTYLIIGESSRFEDYDKDGETRTGCFWIG